jgi:hypothetical protein
MIFEPHSVGNTLMAVLLAIWDHSTLRRVEWSLDLFFDLGPHNK